MGVMYRGRLVEEGTSQEIYENPQHIYTKRLIAAIPELERNNRRKKMLFRKQLTEEYKQSYSHFFDENGRAYDLKSITPTHRVALP